MTRTIAIIFLAFVLCGCGLTIRPNDNRGLDLGAFGQTNSVSGGQITTAVSVLFSALGLPEVGTIAGGMVVGLIWFWRYQRTHRREEPKGSE